MNLKRQMFISFLFVAVLPLLIVSLYLFHISVKLTFDLYQQNLNNSTEIQTDIIEEHINRMLIRSSKFALALEKCGGMEAKTDILKNKEAAAEILKFTEDTQESIWVFALLDEEKEMVYSSGSNRDTSLIRNAADLLEYTEGAEVVELEMGDCYCIAVVIPVQSGGKLVSVYNNEFLLKTISSHVQIETSNAFLYCQAHEEIVKAKREMRSLGTFSSKIGTEKEGGLICEIDGEKAEVYFKRIAKTPWMLVNYIPASHMYSTIMRYAAINVIVVLFCIGVIVILSHLQSRKVLRPMNWLLQAVELFFVSGKVEFSNKWIGQKTEIGYLAEKFNGMASDIALVQEKLRESNYLYEAILRSGYEMCITINYQTNRVEDSSEKLRLIGGQDASIWKPERVLDYFVENSLEGTDWNRELLEDMVFGRLDGPTEGAVSCRLADGTGRWYQVVAVPIFDEKEKVCKTVLHFKNITEQKKEEFKLLRSVQRDPLCGLLNKSALITLAGQRKQVENQTKAMFFIDLDNFKQVNDNLGHLAGDEVLQMAAGILTEAFRSTDLVCRYGGDEFVAFTAGISCAGAKKTAEYLLEKLKIPMEMPGKETVIVTASVGVWISEKEEAVEFMIEQADKAMYTAKQKGKSQYYLIEEQGEDSQ